MSLGLGELTTQAHRLVAAGDLVGARELLDPALAAVDPDPAYASAELTEAAGLHAWVLMALGEPGAARGWAALAFSAATRLHGSNDERAIAAGAALAAVLHRVGSHARSAHLYRRVITELTVLDGPESLRVLAAQADLATVEHARGDCAVANHRLKDAWELHREVYGAGHPSGIKMLARLGAMDRDCGRLTEADRHLALAERLCRTHLSAGHPLTDQVTALHRGAGDPAHTCTGHRPENPGRSTAVPAPPGPPATDRSAASPALVTAGRGHGDPVAQEQAADRYGPVWPPEAAEPTDGLPSVRAADDWPKIRRLQAPSEPRSWVEELPPQGPRSPHRRALPVTIAGLATALLATAAVAAGVALVDAARTPAPPGAPHPPAASPTVPVTSAPATAVPRTAPAGLTLRDTHDAVTLAWTYPPGAEGPLVIAGARAGQSPRAFQELPAGTTRYVVHGLSPNLDYCFSVAIVYATDRINRTDVVCTARARPTS